MEIEKNIEASIQNGRVEKDNCTITLFSNTARGPSLWEWDLESAGLVAYWLTVIQKK